MSEMTDKEIEEMNERLEGIDHGKQLKRIADALELIASIISYPAEVYVNKL